MDRRLRSRSRPATPVPRRADETGSGTCENWLLIVVMVAEPLVPEATLKSFEIAIDVTPLNVTELLWFKGGLVTEKLPGLGHPDKVVWFRQKVSVPPVRPVPVKVPSKIMLRLVMPRGSVTK